MKYVNFIAPADFYNFLINSCGCFLRFYRNHCWIFEKKPKLLGLLTGSVAGLATITPAAGYVSLSSAVIIGTASGLVCYVAVYFKNKRGWDDALDVWGVHGVGGCLGTIMLGVYASKAVNAGGADGLMLGGKTFFLHQVIAVVGACIYAFVFTYLMLAIINFVTKVKVHEDAEIAGLDASIHGEQAYDTGVL